MIIALAIGLVSAGLGILLSILVQSWQVAFILSAVISAISLLIAGTMRNISLINKRRARGGKGYEAAVPDDVERWVKVISLFALPNIVTAVVLYFKIYM